MQRTIDASQDTVFDVLVVGGGIVGACAAWDASLRGLRVALVERADFGSGTSANSLKIIHGGLRYLQDLDFGRTRRSIRERATWLKLAPHLVEPVPFLVPLDGRGMNRPSVLAAGLKIHDLLSWNQNRQLDPARSVPSGRLATVADCDALLPATRHRRTVGGAIFYDGLVYDTERLVLEIVLAAHEAGAMVLNYAEYLGVRSSTTGGGTVAIRDRSEGDLLEVRARAILNAAGPWGGPIASEFTDRDGSDLDQVPSHHCIALNLVTSRPAPEVAFGVEKPEDDMTSDKQRRRVFVVPWRDQTLVGTGYYPEDDDRPEDVLAQDFLRTVNRTLPEWSLSSDEVTRVHMGRLPIRRSGSGDPAHRLLDEGWIRAHQTDLGPRVFSAGTVKYTMGRWVAEKVVDVMCRQLETGRRNCPTRNAPLPGTPRTSMEELRQEASTAARGADLPESIVQHLVRAYGQRYNKVLEAIDRHADGSHPVVPQTPVTVGELIHCAREEMAVRPGDLLFQRTEIGARGWDNPSSRRLAEHVLSENRSPNSSRGSPSSSRLL